MKLAKWGNSLAIRIPADVVAKLGLSPDDEALIRVTGDHSFEVSRDRRREEAIASMRRLARPLPPDYKFNREELHEREWMRRLDATLAANQNTDAKPEATEQQPTEPVAR